MLILGIQMSMNEPIRHHLAAIDAARDVPRLLHAGSPVDSFHPAALEWVRRWRPAAVSVAAVPACSCAVGRCGVCN
jgi:hypothetical protein